MSVPVTNFSWIEIGSKVKCIDYQGKFIKELCGYVVEVQGAVAIVKPFSSDYHYCTSDFRIFNAYNI